MEDPKRDGSDAGSFEQHRERFGRRAAVADEAAWAAAADARIDKLSRALEEVNAAIEDLGVEVREQHCKAPRRAAPVTQLLAAPPSTPAPTVARSIDDAVVARVHAERAGQGLPPTVGDPDHPDPAGVAMALGKVVVMLAAAGR